MKRNVILSMAAALFAVAAGRAAGPAAPVEIDLGQALEIALSDNPTIKVADMEVERQDYVRKETWGNLLPQLSATAAYQNAIVKNTITDGLSFDPTHTVNFGAELTLPLFAPGVYQSLKLNAEQMKAALEAARGSRITMSCEVRKAFYNVLRIEREIAVLKASRDNVRQTVEQLKVGFANGLTSEYDLLTAQVQLSNLEPAIIQAEKGLLVSKMYLMMLMGMPVDRTITLKGSLDELNTDSSEVPLYGIDLSGNSDLRSLDIQQGVMQRQLGVLRTQRMPTLGATLSGSLRGHDPIAFDLSSMGGMGWQSDGSYIGQPYGQWTQAGSWSFFPPAPPSGDNGSKDFEWQHPVSLSVGMSIPIFAGFTKTNREKQLRNSIKQLQTQRDYAEKQIEVQAATSANNVATARERMAATSMTVGQAGKAYDIASVRYKAGAGTILELNAAELQLTQSQLNHTQAIYDLLSAQADYRKILGKE